MRLLYVSLFLWLYAAASLWRLLPFHLLGKVAAGLALLAISLKYVLYERFGGSFFAPELPRAALLVMEALYVALILLVILLLLRDVTAFILWGAAKCFGTAWHIPLSAGKQGAALVLAALLLGGWGAWQSVRVPDVRTVEIILPHLPKSLDGFSIVQLTDLHIRTLLGKEWLEAVVERANAQNPDMIALTGDYIDGSVEKLHDNVAPLAGLRSRFGTYGVTGNHEYYFGVSEWNGFLESLGVRMLHNEHVVVEANGARLIVAGVPDLSESRFGGEGINLDKALRNAPEAVRILLAHQPRGAAGHAGVDVQLSGHTHGGSIFFLKPLLSAYNDGFVSGKYDCGRLQLYVSPGTGIWGGFSCRLGVPSEITRIILRAGQGGETAGK